MMKKYIIITLLAITSICCNNSKKVASSTINVVTTTTMITDMITAIGGDKISIKGLMGSGVDPHLYKASEGDVSKLSQADVIFYSGLHLEGKLEEVFEKMKHVGKETIALASILKPKQLIVSENFASNYDPHIWFQIDYWITCTNFAASELARIDPRNAAYFKKNAEIYTAQLELLKQKNNAIVKQLPKEKRILITAHDAFNYFGKAYDFEVIGLQGLSTATEAGVKDVQNLANFIIKHNVKAIFVESSVPKRTIEALQASVKAKNHEVIIGGELFSDALGTANTPEATYIGMYTHNISTIVNALKE